MGKLIHRPTEAAFAMAGGLLLCLAGITSAAEPAAAPAPAAHAPPPPPPIEPSRYAGDHLEQYLKTIDGILHVGSRVTDPYGLFQDPDTKPVVKLPVKSRATVERAVPFADIVPLIRITTVIAAEKKFLVESRAFSQGEEFPLNFRGKQLRILITEVSARQVEFKNLETGEVAARRLDLLPPGMTAGGTGFTPPGMVSSGADAPLIIEPDSAREPAR